MDLRALGLILLGGGDLDHSQEDLQLWCGTALSGGGWTRRGNGRILSTHRHCRATMHRESCRRSYRRRSKHYRNVIATGGLQYTTYAEVLGVGGECEEVQDMGRARVEARGSWAVKTCAGEELDNFFFLWFRSLESRREAAAVAMAFKMLDGEARGDLNLFKPGFGEPLSPTKKRTRNDSTEGVQMKSLVRASNLLWILSGEVFGEDTIDIQEATS